MGITTCDFRTESTMRLSGSQIPFMTAVLLRRGCGLLLLRQNHSLQKYSCSRGADW